MQNGTVVIADDDAPTREVLGEVLQSDGWTVLQARDGVELVELTCASLPNAVVTDLTMPRMDGLRAARALRRRASTADLLLIAVTARDLTAEQELELRDVFDIVMSKPVRPRDLRRGLSPAAAG